MLSSSSDGVPVVAKPWSLARRIVVAAITFLLIGGLIFAAAGSGGSGRIVAAGSTLVNPILQRVSTSYQGYRAADRIDLASQTGQSNDWSADTLALDYDPVGSVGGVLRLDDPEVSFAATEVPVPQADLTSRGLVQFPLILAAAAPVANLELDGGLVLDAGTLSAIYSGRITLWSDPAIAALNPGVTLPDLPITVHTRSDGSGTTWTFTGYLAGDAGWTAGQSAGLQGSIGTAVRGSRAMIDAVRATPGAIGYAEVGQARRAGLLVAHLRNGAGETVTAAPQSIRAAAAGAAWTPDAPLAVSDGAPGAWPMTATVYVVMRAGTADRETERALAFLDYFYAEAPRQADALGYVPLSEPTVAAVRAYWAAAFEPQS